MVRNLLILCACCVGLAPSYGEADAGELKAGVAKLLDLADMPRPNLDDAKPLYAELKSAFPRDIRVPYAVALVAAQRRRYADAVEYVDAALRLNENVLVLRRARLWLLMTQREHLKAVDEVLTVSKLLADERQDQATRLETARLVGATLAFVEQLGNKQASAQVAPTMRNLEQQLDSNMLKAIQAGSEVTGEQIAQGQQEIAESTEQAKLDELQRRQRKAGELADEQRASEIALVELRPQADDLIAQMKQELQSVESELAPLDFEFNQLSREAASVESTIRSINTQIAILQSRLASTEDQFERDRLLRRIQRLRFERIPFENQFAQLDANARRVNLARQQLISQGQRIEREYASRVKSVRQEMASLERRLKRIESDVKSLEGPNTGSSSKVLSQSLKLEVFAEYEPFPLVEEKRRTLESFR